MSKLVLHLDDEPAIRDIIATTLTSQGFRVRSVQTPSEALHAAQEERPDVFISDLQLDEGDGFETIEQMRAQYPGLKIIILTGVLIDPRVAAKSITHEGDVYLTKTGTLAKIVQEVRRLAGA